MVEKQRAIEMLEESKQSIPFLKENCNCGSPDFIKWQLDTQTAVEFIFPNNKGRAHRFNNIRFNTDTYSAATGRDSSKRAMEHGLNEADAILASMLDEIRKFLGYKRKFLGTFR